MANKKISDLVELLSLGADDLMEIEISTGSSRKLKKSSLSTSLFPGSDGEIPFHQSGGLAVDPELFWDDSTKRMILGAGTPLAKLHINGGVGALTTGIAFGDGDSGIYEVTDDNLTIVGTNLNINITGLMLGTSSSKFGIRTTQTGSSTEPVFLTRASNADTGIGGSVGTVSLIAGGVEGARVKTDGITLPTIGQALWFGDGDTGLYESGDDQLDISIGGSFKVRVDTSALRVGSSLVSTSTTAGVPIFIPNRLDTDTGLGSAAADQLSIIAGGKEIARASEATTEQFIINPQGDLTGTAAAPSLAFGGVGGVANTGFFGFNSGLLSFAFNGTRIFDFSTSISGVSIGRPTIRMGSTAFATSPVYTFVQDIDTGIGRAGADQLSLIAGGVEGIRVNSAAAHSVAGIANYETLVIGDDDIPNKKWVDDALGSVGLTGVTSTSETFLGVSAGAVNTGTANTFLGYLSGNANTTGQSNTFVGQLSGYGNVGGVENTFVGRQTGVSNTSGNYNTFLGRSAGFTNTTGADNTFLGYQSGYNSTGLKNTYVGFQSGYSTTGGSGNTSSGYQAGYLNQTGGNNVFIGREAGYSISTTDYGVYIGAYSGWNSQAASNTMIGYFSGNSNTTGGNNVYIGTNAGKDNTSGANNVYIGSSSGSNNSSGDSSVMVGYQTGISSSGNNNVFLGYQSGNKNTTGEHNTNLGFRSGYNNITGSDNVFLGWNAGYNETGSNKLYISNSNTSAPLIWGDFNTQALTINNAENLATLAVAPTGATSLAIATTGYVDSAVSTYLDTPGAFTASTNATWNATTGLNKTWTVSATTRTLTFTNVSVGMFGTLRLNKSGIGTITLAGSYTFKGNGSLTDIPIGIHYITWACTSGTNIEWSIALYA